MPSTSTTVNEITDASVVIETPTAVTRIERLSLKEKVSSDGSGDGEGEGNELDNENGMEIAKKEEAVAGGTVGESENSGEDRRDAVGE
jgi:hypothetical protein